MFRYYTKKYHFKNIVGNFCSIIVIDSVTVYHEVLQFIDF